MSCPSPAAADPGPNPCSLLSCFAISPEALEGGRGSNPSRGSEVLLGCLGGPWRWPRSDTGWKPGEGAWGKGRALREGSDSLGKS